MKCFPALFLVLSLVSAAAFAAEPTVPADTAGNKSNAGVSLGGGNSVITINGNSSSTITINGSTIIGGSPLVTGEGPFVSEDRKLTAYTAIRLDAPVNMVYTATGKGHLSVSAPANILPLVSTTIEDGTLVVKMTGSAMLQEPIRVTASGPSPAEVSLTGAGSFQGKELNEPGLKLMLSGSGSATATGKAGKIEIMASGSGSADTTEVDAKEAIVNVSGSGSVKAFASDTVDVAASGSGSVQITGNPANKTVDKTGSGSVSVE